MPFRVSLILRTKPSNSSAVGTPCVLNFLLLRKRAGLGISGYGNSKCCTLAHAAFGQSAEAEFSR